jgi:hypothetical protein
MPVAQRIPAGYYSQNFRSLRLRLLEMRKALYVIATIVVAVLAYQTWRRASVPPIARNLPSKIAAADIEFKERLRSRFPVGMAEADLVRDLKEQGFRPPVSYRDTKYATFTANSVPCELTWSVGWRADPEGKITDIDGSYSATCP